jgi:hypothetical protein
VLTLLATSFPDRTGRILTSVCAESLHTSELQSKLWIQHIFTFC